jgi:cell fate regulator YaaT (PSP1 superfamily)
MNNDDTYDDGVLSEYSESEYLDFEYSDNCEFLAEKGINESEINGTDTAYGTDTVYGIEGNAVPSGASVYQLCIICSNETIYAVYDDAELKRGTITLVPTRYGMDLARVSGKVCGRMLQNISKIARIERIASAEDLEKERNNKLKEAEAFEICKQKIIDRNMEMKLVSVHFLLEEPKILFFFTAENRVDFRELVKDLVSVFKIRIELRQIGIRDDTRMTGGLGSCGRPFCCHSISDRLKPVAIKMAKDQKLSLNSMKISGPCGRLLCCLAYEYNFYAEQRRCMPCEGTKIMWGGKSWKIIEVNPLLEKITLTAEDGRRLCLQKEKFVNIDNRWIIKGTPPSESHDVLRMNRHT